LWQESEFIQTKVTAFGWGRLGPFDILSSKLQKVELNVVDASQCWSVHQNFNPNSQICASGVGDTCQVSKSKD
jgi:Trypsin